MSMRPRVFVASSSEGLGIARALQSGLDRDAEITVWDQDVFHPSEYILENTVITTSGMGWDPLLVFSHTVLGAENILFAVDYPFGSYARDSAWMDAVPLPEADKEMIYSGNAERVFSLNA